DHRWPREHDPPHGRHCCRLSTAGIELAERAAKFATSRSYGLLGHRLSCRLDLRFHGIEVEARALLHRRILDGRVGQLHDLFLHEHEPPELVLEPLEVRLRPGLGAVVGPARALERIETQVSDVRYVRLGLLTEPAGWLIDEPELVVPDAHRAQLAFTEVPNLVTVRRPLVCDHLHLVVSV